MRRAIVAVVLGTLAVTATGARAGESADLIRPKDVAALSKQLRSLLVKHAPTTLYEAYPGWGETKRVPNGLEWKEGKVLPLKPRFQYGEKNHGTWRHIKVTAPDLDSSLFFDIRNVKQHEPGRTTFDVAIAFDVKVFVDQERWRSGIKTYDVSVRAQATVKLLLCCELTTRTEPNGTFFPDAVIRLRVTRADLGYDDLEVQHIAGIGGDGAKVIGDMVHGIIREVKPSMERDLLEKGNAAIVKAGDTKEVRVSLWNLLKGEDVLSGPALEMIKKQQK